MSKSKSHKRAQSKAAGKKGRTEVPIRGGRKLDAKRGNTATEVERSGSAARLKQAASRLKDSGCNRRVLQVPQKDMSAAAEAMREVGVKGSVKNMGGTKRRSV